MSYKFAMEDFPVAGVSKLIATQGGAHIYNVTLTSDAWNGAIIKRGDWLSFDNYSEATATDFKGKIVGQAANGNWYVEVTEDGNLDYLLVYNVPIVEMDYTKDMASERHFYLKTGEVARAHELKLGDIFELSSDGFDGDPAVGATLSGVSGKKPTVSA